MQSGTCTRIIALKEPAATLAITPAETELFIGAASGKIYKVRMSKELGASSGEDVFTALEGHTAKVTGLGLSLDCSLLVSSSEDGKCIVWDIPSNQILRTVGLHKGASY